MTPEKQRIAIAEACGMFGFELRGGILTGWLDVEKPGVPVPDYLNDLNACHEMEKSLPDLPRYGVELAKLIGCYTSVGWPCILPGDAGQIACATAAQRCEAFLRTIGKWEELQ